MMHHKTDTLVLSSQDVQRVVSQIGLNSIMDELIDQLEMGIRAFDPSWTEIPARSGFSYERPHSGLVEWMPLYTRGGHVMLKIVGYHPRNPRRFSLPSILSTISAYDSETGHLSVVMDGVLLTALRTGAASAVASRVLASPESSILGLLGCGAQAVTQLHGLSRVFELRKVLIYDIDPDAVDSFQERTKMLGLEIEFISAGVEEVVENADILCTATSIDIGTGPLFDGIETKEHLHINAVGSDFPGKIEVPKDFLKQSFVCPDFYDQAVKEGECQQLDPNEIGAGLLEVVRDPSAFLHIRNQRSVFDSTGWALEDRIGLELFLGHAMEMELGRMIPIETISNYSKSPLDFLSDESENSSENPKPEFLIAAS